VIKIVDKRCSVCEKTYYDVIDDEEILCSCGGQLQRMFSLHKDVQMLPHWEEHMGHEPVWIEDRQHFKKELKKRGLDEVPLKKPKGTLYFT